ncbi:MAG: DUF2339 domain-containing protein [Alphaproteobacteria bacterium]|nr:DUF2339 domain-containing protein [Alphaproteobacteria bacterium]
MRVATFAGAIAFIAAVLMGLGVAIDKGWLGPAARVCLGLTVGTSALLGGVHLRRRGSGLPALGLSGAGLGTVYGSLWAAASLYGLLPRVFAGTLMAAVVAAALLMAVRWRVRSPAWLGLVGGVLTPILLSSGHDQTLLLFGWILLLTSGALAAASARHWPDLAAGAALGGALLVGLWGIDHHRPDQVPVVVAGVAVLGLPHLFAALRRATDPWVAGISAAALVLMPLLALAWLPPVDPLFYDPRSGGMVVRDLGTSVHAALAGAVLLPAGAWLVARRRDWWGVGLAASLVSGLCTLTFAVGWADHRLPPGALLGVVVVAPLAVAALLNRQRLPLVPLPLAAGLAATAGLLLPHPAPMPVALSVAALAVLGVGVALALRAGLLLPALLLGVALPLAMAGATDMTGYHLGVLEPALLAGITLVALAVLVPLPAAARRLGDGAAPAVLTAALAPPLLFLPLYSAWDATLGDALIGLLPLLLGSVSLATAMLLVRAGRVDRSSAALALFVAVALAGFTSAIPLQLERQWLTVAWALEAAALAALSRRLSHPLVRWGGIVLSIAVAVRLLLNPAALEYGDASGPVLLNWTLYTWGLPAICLGLAARWLEPWALVRGKGSGAGQVPVLLRVLAILVGFALVDVQVGHAFHDAGPVELGGHGLLQGMVRSLAWGSYGVAVLVAGIFLERPGGSPRRHVRLVGFALVVLTAGKVFAVDLWALEGFARVGSVLGLGVCLLLSAFLFERLVLRGEPVAPPPEAP